MKPSQGFVTAFGIAIAGRGGTHAQSVPLNVSVSAHALSPAPADVTEQQLTAWPPCMSLQQRVWWVTESIQHCASPIGREV